MESYLHEIAGLTVKDRRPVRSLWHNAAKRYLNLLSITSDPVPPLTTHRVEVLSPEGEVSDSYTVTIKPVASRFLSRPRIELIELYKYTKPKRV